MRIANYQGRAVILQDGAAHDIEKQSEGRFSSNHQDLLEAWEDFREWASTAQLTGGVRVDEADFGPAVPRPRQIFGIGLNYRDHADEAGLDHPENLVVFTKFQSSLVGPVSELSITSDSVDWEAELVAVIGRQVHDVDEDEGLAAVAGYAVGQDFSDRAVQLRPPVPQFALGKSFPGFSPVGPAIVTPDELSDPSALKIRCTIEGPTADTHGQNGSWIVQDGTTADLIFPVGQVVSDLSRVVTLYPGDIIFTGTPAGVGSGRRVFLQEGDSVTTEIEGLGTLHSRCVSRG